MKCLLNQRGCCRNQNPSENGKVLNDYGINRIRKDSL